MAVAEPYVFAVTPDAAISVTTETVPVLEVVVPVTSPVRVTVKSDLTTPSTVMSPAKNPLFALISPATSNASKPSVSMLIELAVRSSTTKSLN